MHPKRSREELEKQVETLAKEPALFARMAAFVNEVEAEKAGTLEEAEEPVVKCIRDAGREAPNSWMETGAQGMPRPVNARRGAKKKSAA